MPPGTPRIVERMTLTNANAPVTVTHWRPELCGPVTFKAPSLYEHLAIKRRVVELANVGVPDGGDRIAPDDLDLRTYRGLNAIATLEYVIHAAPKGFYSADAKGMPILSLANLDDDDLEADDGLVWQLYAAYTHWRQLCREQRGRPAGGDAKE